MVTCSQTHSSTLHISLSKLTSEVMLLTDVACTIKTVWTCVYISYHIVYSYGYLYPNKAVLQRKAQGYIEGTGLYSLWCTGLYSLWCLIYRRAIEVHTVSFSRALCHQVSLNWVLIVIALGMQGVYMRYTLRRGGITYTLTRCNLRAVSTASTRYQWHIEICTGGEISDSNLVSLDIVISMNNTSVVGEYWDRMAVNRVASRLCILKRIYNLQLSLAMASVEGMHYHLTLHSTILLILSSYPPLHYLTHTIILPSTILLILSSYPPLHHHSVVSVASLGN